MLAVSRLLFVDETKAKGYLVAVATATEGQASSVRRDVRALRMRGQRSVHMQSEGARRRRLIADTVAGFAGAGVQAVIYDASAVPGTDLNRRARALREIVADTARTREQARIIFDLDQTLLGFDRRHLVEAVREAEARAFITYDHVRFADDSALTLPDVIAWCWARGGDWRRRIGPIVSEVRTR